MGNSWKQVAQEAIDAGHTIIHDVAAEHGQIVGNVHGTRWLRDAVVADLQESFDSPDDALRFIEQSMREVGR